MSDEDRRRLEDKIDRVLDHVGELRTISARQQISLDHHIARSEAIEKRVEQVASEIEPLKKHVSFWALGGKISAAVTALAAAVAGALKLFVSLRG